MKFTYYTIIGKDLELFSKHVENVKDYAGFDRLPCEKDFLAIIYKNSKIPNEITNKILNFCQDNNIKTFIYEEPTNIFIENLYACWNLGYEKSDEGYVFRAGSDQVFSKDSFIALYEEAEKLRLQQPEKKFVLQANTIENTTRLQEINAVSRHFSFALGNNFKEFNYSSFEKIINRMNRDIEKNILTINDCLKHWEKPTKLMTSLGNIDRVDGCSWLMTKEEWKKYGPLPVILNGITGDVIIHDIMQKNGYEQYIVKDCVTYHFVRGESLDKY